jgi:hypothetical protein
MMVFPGSALPWQGEIKLAVMRRYGITDAGPRGRVDGGIWRGGFRMCCPM